MLPENVQTEVVVEAKLTGKPELAVAVMVNGATPCVTLFNGPNTIVCPNTRGRNDPVNFELQGEVSREPDDAHGPPPFSVNEISTGSGVLNSPPTILRCLYQRGSSLTSTEYHLSARPVKNR